MGHHVDTNEKHKIAELAAMGKSNRAIARAVDRSDFTVAKVLRDPAIVAVKEDIQTRLAAKYEQMAESILDSISEEDMLKASLQQKAISSATMLDKARLIQGSSTSNSSIMLRAVMDSINPNYNEAE
jgi:IS30 family transposase